MLIPILASLLLQGSREFPASRTLPENRTFLAVDVKPARTLWENSHRIAQLAIWKRERMLGPFRYAANDDKGLAALMRRAGVLEQLLARFDRGWTGAMIFVERGKGSPEPQTFFAAHASDARRTRNVDALLAKVLGLDAREDDVLQQHPIGDSPVSAKRHLLHQDRETGDWRIDHSVLSAIKGKRAAFRLQREWTSRNDEESAKVRQKSNLATIGDLIGVGRRERSSRKLGQWPPLPDGAKPIARCLMRVASLLQSEKYGVNDGDRERAKKCGFWEWDGFRSVLFATSEGGMHTRSDVFFGEDKLGPSFFECFQGNERGLGDDAAAVPSWAFGAARIAIDGKHATEWLRVGCGEGFAFGDADVRGFLGWVRSLAGLKKVADPTLEGLDEITFALLPPAAGSLLPEALAVIRTPPSEREELRILTELSDRLANMTAGKAASPRALGKGEDKVYYLPLKDLIRESVTIDLNQAAMNVLMSLFGGGFVSVKRVGEYLYVGFNPRTVRRVVRAVRKGDVLAKREGFLSKFPKASGRAVEMWCDFPKLAAEMRFVDMTLPMWIFTGSATIVEGAPPGAKPGKPRPKAKLVFPKREDFVAVASEEWLWSERQPNRWIIHSRGGTLLSPPAWVAFGMAAGAWSDLSLLAK